MAHVALVITAALFGVGCGSGDERSVERSAFLGDVSQLEPGKGHEPSLLYISPTADFSAYECAVIDPVTVWHASGSSPDRLPGDELRALAVRFESAIRRRMQGSIFEVVDAATGERLAAAIDDRLVAAPGEEVGDRLAGDTVLCRAVEAFLDSRARRLAARLSALHQLSAPEAAAVPNDGLGGDGASPARVGLRP
jgi:hypothetical protein